MGAASVMTRRKDRMRWSFFFLFFTILMKRCCCGENVLSSLPLLVFDMEGTLTAVVKVKLRQMCVAWVSRAPTRWRHDTRSEAHMRREGCLGGSWEWTFPWRVIISCHGIGSWPVIHLGYMYSGGSICRRGWRKSTVTTSHFTFNITK